MSGRAGDHLRNRVLDLGSTTSVVVLVGGQTSLCDRGYSHPSECRNCLSMHRLAATTVVITTGGGTSAPFNVTLTRGRADHRPSQWLHNGRAVRHAQKHRCEFHQPGEPRRHAGRSMPRDWAQPIRLHPPPAWRRAICPPLTLPTLTVGGVAATVLYAGDSQWLAGTLSGQFHGSQEPSRATRRWF